ncbi:MAG: hypothetical protein KDJ65_26615 [Anaerolineae bacterium]|nr:hypothetical protein [Anaerolineae bacterium]
MATTNILPQGPYQGKTPQSETYPSKKKCYICGDTYPRDLAHFYLNELTGDGLTWMCIPCYDQKIGIVENGGESR